MSKRQADRVSRLRREKRGVVLLVVVSILTLFLMIGVTYVLVAGNYNQASRQALRARTHGDEPEREAEEVLAQILFGNANPRSAIAPHNLLADMYGSDGIIGTIGASSPQNNGQTLQLTFQFGPNATFPPFNRQFAASRHYYAGRVVTFLDGAASGLSSRVMGYYTTFDQGTGYYTGTLFVEAPESDLPISVTPNPGSRFLINGAPFNGTGFGLDLATGNIDQADPNVNHLVALQPNFSAYSNGGFALGGADESWDAADLNNMLLSVVAPWNQQQNLPIIPSLHRPELVNYWLNGKSIDPTTPAGQTLFRQAILRPMPWDHPNFSGSNPAFGTTIQSAINAAINGPWDVDNDGDGIAESIWVDAGLPVVTAPNGRRYKRLVAICVKDLDGRINLNAAGNLSQTVPQYRADQPLRAKVGLAPAGTVLSRGMGYGPAELDFMNIFGGFSGGGQGPYQQVLGMRYGFDNTPGVANSREGLHIVKHHGLPNDYSQQPLWYGTPPDVWGRGAIALDTAGQPVTLYMGQAGETLDNPYEIQLQSTRSGADAHYGVAELERLLRFHDLGSSNLTSGRLGPYFNGPSPGKPDQFQRRRDLVTTHSFSAPVVMTSIPKEMRQDPNIVAAALQQGSVTLLDLYRAKLIAKGAANVDLEINKIVPWEIRHGQLFDLNRFLGNGIDDDGNQTPDDLAEVGGEPAWLDNPAIPGQFRGIAAWHHNDIQEDFNGDGNVDATDIPFARKYSRQIYARHLYCLMMLLKDQDPLFVEATLNQPGANHDGMTARRIAQWAINVVDFRDADAIMTPFEYDANPFNGWNVDGILGSPSIDDTNAERGLVWGAEAPDLLISEVFATHDKRLKDTSLDSMKHKRGDKKPDDDTDLDQFRIPQGSLFVELYCPRARQGNNLNAPANLQTSSGYPRELYSFDVMSNTWYLDLGRYNATPDANGVIHPVWRIAISQNHRLTANPTSANSAYTRGLSNYDTTTFDPESMNAIDQLNHTSPSPSRLIIERQVWFANCEPPAGTPEAANTFVNIGASAFIVPGQYAVVGPRATTYIGSIEKDADPYGTVWDDNSPQRITLAPKVNVFDLGGATEINGNAVAAAGIVADMRPPATWGNQAWRIGMNVTEPLPQSGAYYDEFMAGATPLGAYDDWMTPNYTVPDHPFDYDITKPPGTRPLVEANMTVTGFYDNCNSLFLQRLANPTLPFNAVTNPYITVDWASADVNVFNGEEDINRKTTNSNGNMVSIDPSDVGPIPSPRRFGARQRGQIPNQPNYNLWNPYAEQPGLVTTAATGTAFVDFKFENTIGYLNAKFGAPQPGGDPQFPFPWLAWNNRPYMNAMELLTVPQSAPARLCHEFQDMSAANVSRTISPYNAGGSYAPPFTHIPNFYLSSFASGSSPQFVRMLNCVEVPSPYVGTEKWYNPDQTQNSQNFGDPNIGIANIANTFRPPFNKLSRFGDPGRININTAFDPQVLEAATSQLPDLPAGFIDKLFRSRQGYGGAFLAINNEYPTRFANPFRSPDSSDLMPNVGTPRNMQTSPVEATLLRSDPDIALPNPNGPGDVPLVGSQVFPPLSHIYNQPDRNAYFASQSLQKLGSVFTTQSNCYAVWITVGYFEVEANTNNPRLPPVIDAAHPDGLRLAQEVGVDTGEVKRHRAFYIIDRSVPVGYEPGHRHNTDKAILLKRFIE